MRTLEVIRFGCRQKAIFKSRVLVGFLLAIASLYLLTPAPCWGATNKELRAQIQTLERRLKDYPSLANVIGPELKQKRLELLAQLQSDIYYLNSVADSVTGSDKTALLAQLKTLNDEVATVQSALSGATDLTSHTAASSANDSQLSESLPSGTANAATHPTSLDRRPPEASVNGSPEPPRPEAAHVTVSAATVQPGVSTSGSAPATASASSATASTSMPQLPEPQFAPAIRPSRVKLVVDIARDWQTGDFEKGCSNKPSDQTSNNWVIRIAAIPLWGDDNIPKSYQVQGTNILVPVLVQNATTEGIKIAVGANSYTGHFQAFARKIDLSFGHLTLAQAADLVQRLTTDASVVQKAFTDAQVTLKIYQLSATADPNKYLTPRKIYEGLKCHLEPAEVRQKLLDIDPSTDFEQELQACTGSATGEKGTLSLEAAPAMRLRIRALAVDKSLMRSLTLDATSIQKTKLGLKMLADNQLVTTSSDPKVAKESADPEDPKQAESEGDQPVDNKRAQLLLIDNPCFHVSVNPLLNGGEITPVVNFRYDYNYFSEGNAVIARLHAEGEGADTNKYFQRIQGSGNLTTLLGTASGWQFYGGAVGTVAGTRNTAGMGTSEWTGGGQFQLQAPVLTPFNVLSGANSRPTWTVAFGATGGDATSTGATNFIVSGLFVYTFRPTTQLSIDLKAQGAWSDQPRFANHTTYAYVNFVGRYNIKGDLDFLGKYECGRKDPDYRKFCGWQTGFTLLTGR